MKKSMINTNIRKSFYLLVAIFLIVILYLLYILVFKSDELIDNPYNQKKQVVNNCCLINEMDYTKAEVLYE